MSKLKPRPHEGRHDAPIGTWNRYWWAFFASSWAFLAVLGIALTVGNWNFIVLASTLVMFGPFVVALVIGANRESDTYFSRVMKSCHSYRLLWERSRAVHAAPHPNPSPRSCHASPSSPSRQRLTQAEVDALHYNQYT